MKITFLGASVPLTKSFTATTKSSYPNVADFSSTTYEITSIEELHTAIAQHASQGHCLLKGELTRPLVKESRAKSTDAQIATEWLCFDFDGLPPSTNLDALLDSFPGCLGTDYIVQYSASHGVTGQPNLLKAHVFVLLDAPQQPNILKQLITQLNIENPTLSTNLKLTKTASALSYGLDPTVAQNDKLIYIAPPQCDPASLDEFIALGKTRIKLVKRTKRFFSPDVANLKSPELIKSRIETKINELRSLAGLPPKKKFNYVTDHKSGVSYLTKPDKSIVTGVKTDRGFVYLNLNGGDSWAYYHAEDNPTFLYNFKDEPVYKLSELAPEYYATAKAHANKIKSGQIQTISHDPSEAHSSSAQTPDQKPIYLVFRDMTTAIYYNGIFNPVSQSWQLARAGSEKMLSDFMVQNGQPEPEVIPIWNLVFDPSKPPIDVANRVVNLYEESSVLKKAKTNKCEEIPPTIKKVIHSAVGSDDETYHHFINWIAYIIQNKNRTQTAWLLNGVQGTGKGILAHRILRPILGHNNTAFMEAVQLEDKFNEAFERSLLTFIDEMTIGDLEGSSKIMGTMKSLITEPIITIRKMRSAPYTVPNYNNWIAFANTKEQVKVEMSDRRYNVGIYQTQRLDISDEEIEKNIPNELVDFASYLLQYEVDINKAHKVLNNQARNDMQDLSMNSIDKISNAVTKGDLEELYSYIVELNHAQGKTMSTAPLYKDLMHNIFIQDYKALSREELQIIFSHCVGDVPTSPTKFSRFLAHHDIKVSPVSRGHQVFRGIKVDWFYDQAWYDEVKAKIIAEKGPKLKIVDAEEKTG
jgi:hypothetical protein